MNPTPEQIAKLPRWAQEHIENLTRQRATAVRALNEYCDNQTPSPIHIDEYESTGEQCGPSSKTRYIQSHRIEVDWQGVHLSVILRDDHIDLKWEGMRRSLEECSLIPYAFQAARLKSPDSLRPPAQREEEAENL